MNRLKMQKVKVHEQEDIKEEIKVESQAGDGGANDMVNQGERRKSEGD